MTLSILHKPTGEREVLTLAIGSFPTSLFIGGQL
jgi:hypothetical protein